MTGIGAMTGIAARITVQVHRTIRLDRLREVIVFFAAALGTALRSTALYRTGATSTPIS